MQLFTPVLVDEMEVLQAALCPPVLLIPLSCKDPLWCRETLDEETSQDLYCYETLDDDEVAEVVVTSSSSSLSCCDLWS